ncbi:MAG: nucleotide pyrophosphohydrolase [Actinomycetaceae bacterium]|nr:nucleotide pyrophosphohydrolase [Actinomycetaceae bacterium]
MNFEGAVAKALAFREERDWSQFHNPKDLALSISLEAAELLEVFQWSGADLEVASKAREAREELADVLIYCIYMADRLGVDLVEAISDKIDANDIKYPVQNSRGNSRKYDELC